MHPSEALCLRVPTMRLAQIMMKVTKGERLEVPDLASTLGGTTPVEAELLKLMRACWAQAPADRPRFHEILGSIRAMTRAVAGPKAGWAPDDP